MLYYNATEQHLIVHLLSARGVHTDDSYNVKNPIISIQLHGHPDTEVTSKPDEAPNPEYDEKYS